MSKNENPYKDNLTTTDVVILFWAIITELSFNNENLLVAQFPPGIAAKIPECGIKIIFQILAYPDTWQYFLSLYLPTLVL